jgi:PAS domain S-box-containing protein
MPYPSFQSFIEESNDALAKIDGLGRVIMANRHWCQLVGPQVSDASVAAWPNLPEALLKVQDDERSFNTEVVERNLPLHGTLVRLFASADPSRARLLCRIRPVHAGLAPTRDRFFTLIDQFPFAIGVHRDLRFLYVNQAAVRYLGYDSHEELVGQPIVSIIAPDDLPVVRQRVAHMMRTGLPLPERETRMLHKNGSVVSADLAAFMIRDEDGLPSYVVVARDITERRALEERLRQSQRMEAVGRLAGGIAHDFNNVLAVVLSYAELLMNPRAGLDVGQSAYEIRRAAERAAALVRELLTFSKGHLAEISSQSPNAVLNGLREFLQRSVGPAITLEYDLDPTLPNVRAGTTHLEQVFVNLALNARDAMSDGGRLIIRTRQADVGPPSDDTPSELDEGRYGVFEVEDNGFGMPPDVANRAFEPFFSTKGSGLGTGLGLATVYGIAKQAGGSAEISSRPGLGTTIRLYWPLDRTIHGTGAMASGRLPAGDFGTHTPGSEPTPEPSAGASPRLLSGQHIMLVEDDEAVRIMVARLLRHQGADVSEAQSARDALALQEQLLIRGDALPSLLLTDVVMPDEAGPQLARQMRLRQPTLKVVFMSGYADENLDIDEVHLLGARFVQKPFSTRDLVDTIAATLTGDAPHR